jgi:hypothetical protein
MTGAQMIITLPLEFKVCNFEHILRVLLCYFKFGIWIILFSSTKLTAAFDVA